MKINLIFTLILTVTLLSTLAWGQGGACGECRSFGSQKIYLEKSENRILSIEAKLFETKLNDQKHWYSQIVIRSFDKRLNYFNLKQSDKPILSNPNSVIVSGDQNRINNISIYYLTLREKVVNGVKKGFSGFHPIIKDGKVFDEKNSEVSGLLEEILSVNFNLDEFKKLSDIKKLTIMIDSKTYNLKKDQVNEIQRIAQKAISDNL